MLIFYRPQTDPYLNIAAEEYYIRHATEDICMIWTNSRSVIIGKHQNAFAEINYPYMKANDIPVIRRISGGGAVYHDAGNVNFTFIANTIKTNQVDFSRFTSIIAGFMRSLGIDVMVGKRNSLFVGKLKFSGHAEHIFHTKVLHHGTILFNTDLDALQFSLYPAKVYEGKAMASVRSEVGNIAPLLPCSLSIDQFIDKLVSWLSDYYPGSKPYQMTEYDTKEILQLAETKYRTWQWNFGYSPAYSFRVEIPIHAGFLPVMVKVENGKFVQVVFPNGFPNPDLAGILSELTGVLHKEEEMDGFVKKNRPGLELEGVNTVSFSEAFFT
ncbi:MAG: lipoate--protein ligase [Bacteroidota bacterium]